MKLLLDEMHSPAVADELRARGRDVTAVAELAPLRGLPDGELFLVAQSEGRVLVTANIGDYRRIHLDWIGRGQAHFGILFTVHERWCGSKRIGALVAALDEWLDQDAGMTSNEWWL